MATKVVIPQSPISGSSPFSPHQRPVVVFKPKLSLNTAACPAQRSRGSTAIRLDTLSTISPTVRNTFKNTFEAPTTAAESTKLPMTASPRPSTPIKLVTRLNTSSPGLSPTSSQGSSPETSSVPYSIPPHICPILKNSPLPKVATARISMSATTPRRFFPPTKRVAFRPQICEEITTHRFTLRHSDIPDTPPVLSPVAGTKRESPSPTENEEDDSDDAAIPKTPLAGRRKKRREWTWTLGPLDGSSEQRLSGPEESHGDSRLIEGR